MSLMGEVDGKMGNLLSELYIEAVWKIPHTWLRSGKIIGGNIKPVMVRHYYMSELD